MILLVLLTLEALLCILLIGLVIFALSKDWLVKSIKGSEYKGVEDNTWFLSILHDNLIVYGGLPKSYKVTLHLLIPLSIPGTIKLGEYTSSTLTVIVFIVRSYLLFIDSGDWVVVWLVICLLATHCNIILILLCNRIISTIIPGRKDSLFNLSNKSGIFLFYYKHLNSL